MPRSVLPSDLEGPELTTAGRWWRPMATGSGRAAVEWAEDLSSAGPPQLEPEPGHDGAHLVSNPSEWGRARFPRGRRFVEDFALIGAAASESEERRRMLVFVNHWGYLRQPIPLFHREVHGRDVSVTSAGFGEPASVWRAESRAIAAVRSTIDEANQLKKTGAESSRAWLNGRLFYVTEDPPNPDEILRFGGLPAFFGYDPVDGEDVKAETERPAPRKMAAWPVGTSWPPDATEEEMARSEMLDLSATGPGWRIARRYEGDGQTLIPTFKRLPLHDTAALVDVARRAVRQFVEGRLRQAMSPALVMTGRGLRYYPRDLITAIYLQLCFELAGVDTGKERPCDECRELYHYERSRRSRFCSNRCKLAWHRRQRRV